MDILNSNFTTQKYFFRPLNTFGSEINNFQFSSTNHKIPLLTPLIKTC